MTARPILFSAPMVQALVDDRKTQTRRTLKPQPPAECSIHYMLGNESWLPPSDRSPLRHSWEAWGGPLYEAKPPQAMAGTFEVKCPYGAPGDLLIVRETHWRWGRWRKDGLTAAGHQRWRFVPLDTHPVAYCLPTDKRRALSTCYPGMDRETVGYWKRPSLFMPRRGSRLTLEITDVRVERLQDISEADARAEGLIEYEPTDEDPAEYAYEQDGDIWNNAVSAYAALWKSINGPDSWTANPWVWVVAFKVHETNVDQLLAARGAS